MAAQSSEINQTYENAMSIFREAIEKGHELYFSRENGYLERKGNTYKLTRFLKIESESNPTVSLVSAAEYLVGLLENELKDKMSNKNKDELIIEFQTQTNKFIFPLLQPAGERNDLMQNYNSKVSEARLDLVLRNTNLKANLLPL